MSREKKVGLTYLSVFLAFIVVMSIIVLTAKPNDPNSDKQKYSQPQSEFTGHDISMQEAQQMELNFVAHRKVKSLQIHGLGIRFPAKDILEVASQPGAEYVDLRFFAKGEGQLTNGVTAVDKKGLLLPEKKEMGSCCEDVISLSKIKLAPVATADSLLNNKNLIGKK
jgi:hypothetical protein